MYIVYIVYIQKKNLDQECGKYVSKEVKSSKKFTTILKTSASYG